MKTKTDVSLGQFDQWNEAQQVLVEQRKDVKELVAEKQALESRVTVSRVNSIDDRAAQLLSGAQWVDPTRLVDQITQIDEEISVRQRAIEMQQQRLSGLGGQLSLKICEKVQPEYRLIRKDIAAACYALIETVEAEISFIDDLLQHNVELGHLGRVTPGGGPGRLVELLKAYAEEAGK